MGHILRTSFYHEERRKLTHMLPVAKIIVFLHLQDGISLHVTMQHVIREAWCLQNYCLLSKVKTLNQRGQEPTHISPCISHMKTPKYDLGDHRW